MNRTTAAAVLMATGTSGVVVRRRAPSVGP